MSDLNGRVDKLEDTLIEIKSEMKWVKRVGYYMATIVTALTIKLMFFGI